MTNSQREADSWGRVGGSRLRGARGLTLGRLSATLVLSGALLMAPATSGLHAAEKVIEPLVVGWERYFKFEWEVVERRGQPVVRGYVTNDSPYTVGRIQLLLDTLDGTGRVAA